jgi:hypothetical protein
MVTGFFLDPMHLIDGGVLKDFIRRIVGACKGGRQLNALQILPRLNARLDFWKKYNLIEQSRVMKLVHLILICILYNQGNVNLIKIIIVFQSVFMVYGLHNNLYFVCFWKINTNELIWYIISRYFYRNLDNNEHWKMREYHIFFMYYAYPLFAPIAHQIRQIGQLIMEAMAHLLLAMNLVKGFSMEVFYNLILLHISFLPIYNIL